MLQSKLTSVDLVSDSLNDAEEQQITKVVFALPPRDSSRMRVSLEFLRKLNEIKIS